MEQRDAIIHRKTYLTPTTIELELHYDPSFDFTPGQFVSVAIPTPPGERPCRRSYSIASSPNFLEGKGMILCIKIVPDGQASAFFDTVEEGASLSFMGPLGHFMMTDKSTPKLFVATGTGIAPFKAMMEELEEEQNTAPLTLIFGLRNEQDIFYQNWLDSYQARNPHFEYHITLSNAPDTWEGFHGRVTDYCKTHDPLPNTTHHYFCGNGPMIDDMNALMQAQGFTKEQIHFEKYFV